MNLTYEALDARGKRTRDKLEAADPRAAVELLRRQGLFVTRIEESATAAPPKARLKIRSSDTPHMPLKALVVFTRQMAMLLKAGSGVVPAIGAIKRQMKKPMQAAVLSELSIALEEGSRLHDALRRFPKTFDSVYCAIIAAGEASATLPQMFERLAGIVGKKKMMRNKLIGALMYPLLLMLMSFKILLLLLLFVVPRFQDMFIQLSVEPPPSTQLLLAVGAALRGHWILLTVAFLLTVVGSALFLVSERGKQWLSDVQLRVPVVGRIRAQLLQGQVFRTMGTLLDSGVGVLEAIDLVRDTTRNRRFRRLFDDLVHAITSGGLLAATFEKSGLIDPYVCQAVYTGEESGSMGGALTYSADMMDEANTETIQTALKLLEPMILIVMGVVVGSVAVSLFVPLFDLTSAMR